MDKKLILPALLLFGLLGWNACRREAVTVPASAADYVTVMGRTVTTPEGSVAFNYPGVTAMVKFEGERLDMETIPGSGYFSVEVDEGAPKRILIAEGDSTVCLADSLGQGEHTVRVTYSQEGYEKNPAFRSFSVSAGGHFLAAPARPQGPRIEFIGNSITCGYGAAAPDGSHGFSYDTEDHCLTYAYLTARALDADFNVVARSGIGMYRNYNGPREGDTWGTMPLEYDHTMLYDTVHPWDFKRFQPDIVCINLGTNDTSTDNYDITLFREAYDRFLTRLRGNYPSAKFVLLTGCMMNGKELADVRAALDSLASIHPGAYRLDMSPQTGDLGIGSDSHPSARQHEKMARELTSFLLELDDQR